MYSFNITNGTYRNIQTDFYTYRWEAKNQFFCFWMTLFLKYHEGELRLDKILLLGRRISSVHAIVGVIMSRRLWVKHVLWTLKIVKNVRFVSPSPSPATPTSEKKCLVIITLMPCTHAILSLLINLNHNDLAVFNFLNWTRTIVSCTMWRKNFIILCCSMIDAPDFRPSTAISFKRLFFGIISNYYSSNEK